MPKSRVSTPFHRRMPLWLGLLWVGMSQASSLPAAEAPQPMGRFVLTAAQSDATPATKAETTPATTASTPSDVATDYVSREDVMAFLKKVSEEKKIPLEWLTKEVAVARYSPLSEKYTTPRPQAPAKTTPEKNFLLYEHNIVNDERIVRGAEFFNRNYDTLMDIAQKTGVNPYVVTAIIGVESIYGRNMGRFKVLDALMTLSFDYTRRANFYRSELSNFLAFCWREQVAPVSITGSFAGAMGLGQFMPSSLLAYGADGDNDQRIDIVNSEADGIASVANFLKIHGWDKNDNPLYQVQANTDIFNATKSGGIKAHTTVGDLLKAGVKPLPGFNLKDDEPALLVDLPWIRKDNTRGTTYYIGTRSFEAILHYNKSYFYAAAVTFLAGEIQARVEQQRGQTPTTPTAVAPDAPVATPAS